MQNEVTKIRYLPAVLQGILTGTFLLLILVTNPSFEHAVFISNRLDCIDIEETCAHLFQIGGDETRSTFFTAKSQAYLLCFCQTLLDHGFAFIGLSTSVFVLLYRFKTKTIRISDSIQRGLITLLLLTAMFNVLFIARILIANVTSISNLQSILLLSTANYLEVYGSLLGIFIFVFSFAVNFSFWHPKRSCNSE